MAEIINGGLETPQLTGQTGLPPKYCLSMEGAIRSASVTLPMDAVRTFILSDYFCVNEEVRGQTRLMGLYQKELVEKLLEVPGITTKTIEATWSSLFNMVISYNDAGTLTPEVRRSVEPLIHERAEVMLANRVGIQSRIALVRGFLANQSKTFLNQPNAKILLEQLDSLTKVTDSSGTLQMSLMLVDILVWAGIPSRLMSRLEKYFDKKLIRPGPLTLH